MKKFILFFSFLFLCLYACNINNLKTKKVSSIKISSSIDKTTFLYTEKNKGVDIFQISSFDQFGESISDDVEITHNLPEGTNIENGENFISVNLDSISKLGEFTITAQSKKNQDIKSSFSFKMTTNETLSANYSFVSINNYDETEQKFIEKDELGSVITQDNQRLNIGSSAINVIKTGNSGINIFVDKEKFGVVDFEFEENDNYAIANYDDNKLVFIPYEIDKISEGETFDIKIKAGDLSKNVQFKISDNSQNKLTKPLIEISNHSDCGKIIKITGDSVKNDGSGNNLLIYVYRLPINSGKTSINENDEKTSLFFFSENDERITNINYGKEYHLEYAGIYRVKARVYNDFGGLSDYTIKDFIIDAYPANLISSNTYTSLSAINKTLPLQENNSDNLISYSKETFNLKDFFKLSIDKNSLLSKLNELNVNNNARIHLYHTNLMEKENFYINGNTVLKTNIENRLETMPGEVIIDNNSSVSEFKSGISFNENYKIYIFPENTGGGYGNIYAYEELTSDNSIIYEYNLFHNDDDFTINVKEPEGNTLDGSYILTVDKEKSFKTAFEKVNSKIVLYVYQSNTINDVYSKTPVVKTFTYSNSDTQSITVPRSSGSNTLFCFYKAVKVSNTSADEKNAGLLGNIHEKEFTKYLILENSAKMEVNYSAQTNIYNRGFKVESLKGSDNVWRKVYYQFTQSTTAPEENSSNWKLLLNGSSSGNVCSPDLGDVTGSFGKTYYLWTKIVANSGESASGSVIDYCKTPAVWKSLSLSLTFDKSDSIQDTYDKRRLKITNKSNRIAEYYSSSSINDTIKKSSWSSMNNYTNYSDMYSGTSSGSYNYQIRVMALTGEEARGYYYTKESISLSYYDISNCGYRLHERHPWDWFHEGQIYLSKNNSNIQGLKAVGYWTYDHSSKYQTGSGEISELGKWIGFDEKGSGQYCEGYFSGYCEFKAKGFKTNKITITSRRTYCAWTKNTYHYGSYCSSGGSFKSSD